MKKRLKVKNIILVFSSILILVLLVGIFIGVKKFEEDKKAKDLLEKEKKEKDLIAYITNKYSEYATVENESIIYINDSGTYKEYGYVYPDFELALETDEITKDTKYFKIVNLDNEYYISYEDIIKIDSLKEKKDRYKKYIPFNQNVVTEDVTIFYKDDKEYIKIKESVDLPIYIKDDNKYYVEYNNELVYVLKDEVKEIKESKNSEKQTAKDVIVFAYHFIYDPDKGSCNEIICHSKAQFTSHLDYLKDNSFLTLTMNEFEMFIDGKINVPKKSVLMTVDDGAQAENASKYVTERELNATLFMISSWYDKSQFETEYFEVHSHTHNMHNPGECPTGQGGAIQCKSREYILADLKSSREKLNNTTALCYPFYEYNDYSISVAKEAGFTMGFGGLYEGGHLKMQKGGDKFRIPRVTILSTTTLNDFVYYANL